MSKDEFVPPFETGYIRNDGKNLMMTNTPQTMEERKKQERIWKEVINQMQNSIVNLRY